MAQSYAESYPSNVWSKWHGPPRVDNVSWYFGIPIDFNKKYYLKDNKYWMTKFYKLHCVNLTLFH